jgi:hypothetical protein
MGLGKVARRAGFDFDSRGLRARVYAESSFRVSARWDCGTSVGLSVGHNYRVAIAPLLVVESRTTPCAATVGTVVIN